MGSLAAALTARLVHHLGTARAVLVPPHSRMLDPDHTTPPAGGAKGRRSSGMAAAQRQRPPPVASSQANEDHAVGNQDC
jgi:hypothetical protein